LLGRYWGTVFDLRFVAGQSLPNNTAGGCENSVSPGQVSNDLRLAARSLAIAGHAANGTKAREQDQNPNSAAIRLFCGRDISGRWAVFNFSIQL